jgi:hypothetical protein
MSDNPADSVGGTKPSHMRVPRFNRTDVGRSNRISLANADSRDGGSREVVTNMGGSTMPNSCAYSSSRSSYSCLLRSGPDSSY